MYKSKSPFEKLKEQQQAQNPNSGSELEQLREEYKGLVKKKEQCKKDSSSGITYTLSSTERARMEELEEKIEKLEQQQQTQSTNTQARMNSLPQGGAGIKKVSPLDRLKAAQPQNSKGWEGQPTKQEVEKQKQQEEATQNFRKEIGSVDELMELKKFDHALLKLNKLSTQIMLGDLPDVDGNKNKVVEAKMKLIDTMTKLPVQNPPAANTKSTNPFLDDEDVESNPFLRHN